MFSCFLSKSQALDYILVILKGSIGQVDLFQATFERAPDVYHLIVFFISSATNGTQIAA